MQVNEETCLLLSCSKVGLYACTTNDSANATFLFCLDSLIKILRMITWPLAMVASGLWTTLH